MTVRDVVRVAGADAATFLQGQLSQDVLGLPEGGVAWSLVLQPQGKVDAWVRVHRVDVETFDLDVDPSFGDALATRLSRFLIRTAATVTVSSADVELEWPAADGLHDAPLDEGDRIRAGIPAMGAELGDSTIPGEVGQWFVDASVSFTKGCFVGQELVARIDSRGNNVPRRLRVLTVDGAAPVGADIVVGGDVVGTVTSTTDGAALGYVKRSVDGPTDADLRWSGGTATATIAG